MILYKYLRPERIDVLRGGRIRYTQPIYFNDPFDTKPVFRADERRERMELQSLAAAKRFGWTDGQRLRIVEQLEKMYHSSLELFPVDSPESVKETIEWTVELLGASTAILSLAERPDSVLMWSHYACDHSGFVVGFDVEHPEWNRVGPEDDADQSGVLRKVRYSSVRPNWGTLNMDRMGMFFTKSSEWEYEQEWRIFRGVEEADHVIKGVQDVCLFNFSKASVRQVILGERASDDMQSEIIRLLNADHEYASVEVLRVRIDKLGFGLNLESIPRT